MALVLWRLLAFLAISHLAVTAKTPPNQSAQPPPKETKPLFSPEYTSRPLRVLAIVTFASQSHFIMFKTLMSEMAKRGHQITMFSPFPMKPPVANYTDIDLSGVLPTPPTGLPFQMLSDDNEKQNPFGAAQFLAMFDGPQTCKDVLNHPEVRAVINGEKQFDVLFTEIFGTDCFLAVGHKLQIPTISLVTTHNVPRMYEYVGDFDNPAVVESAFLEPVPEGLSSFDQRNRNIYYHLMAKHSVEVVLTRPCEEVIYEVFGKNFPSLRELRNNVSLILANTHPSLFTAKPTVPRILPVGGLHLTPPQPEKVPKDIREWLDSAPNGFVYFSVGSVIISNSIPEHLMKAFVGAFKQHKKLRFLWKFDATEAEAKAAGIPDNVKIAKWLPQNEILSHPKIVAFITHGGLMGTTEAIYHGVPMIGMAVFADQKANVAQYERIGIALRIDHKDLTKEDVAEAITKVTTDSSIRQRVKEVSWLFRDRPMSPLDSAIWWTEYVVRHGGAPHLESPTARMPFWQYALLDVAAVALAVLLTLVCVIYLVVKYIFRLFTRTKPTPKTERRKKKE